MNESSSHITEGRLPAEAKAGLPAGAMAGWRAGRRPDGRRGRSAPRPGRSSRPRLWGDRAGDAAGRPRPDDPRHRAPDDRPRSRAAHRRVVGDLGLRGHGGGQYAAVGQARRPPRPQAAARDLTRVVPRRLGGLRSGSGHDDVDRLARRPGCRRRRPDDAGDGGRRRSRLSSGAGSLPGLYRGRVRARDGRRAADRRPARAARELAMGVLRQPPARRRRARGVAFQAARVRDRRAPGPGGRGGRDPARRRDDRA